MLAENQKMMDENSMRNRSYLMQELGIHHLIQSWGLIRTVVLTQCTDYRDVGHKISTIGNLAQNQTNAQQMITREYTTEVVSRQRCRESQLTYWDTKVVMIMMLIVRAIT